jgi:hypothetical protein
LSNKNKRYLAQITNKEDRTRFYLELRKRLDATKKGILQTTNANVTNAKPGHEIEEDGVQRTDPNAHYQIGTRTSEHYDLLSWLGENAGDPAFKVCQHPSYWAVLIDV